MANNRIIYQSDALFISKTVDSSAASDHVQLRRVQSANYSLNVSRTDVNQFGQLARIDSIILESPSVSFDTSYYLGDGFNEMALGFLNNAGLKGGFISGQIEATSGNNFYILSTPEGVDVNSPRTDIDLDTFTETKEGRNDFSTIGIGNAFVTDYTLDASVGDIPTVSVSLEGTNMVGTAGVSGKAGASYSGIVGAGINPENGLALASQSAILLPEANEQLSSAIPTALRPGDITVQLDSADAKSIVAISGADGGHVQSVSLSIPMGRTPIDRLGSKFAFARVVDFPITPTLSVSAIVSDTKSKALSDMIANDGFIDEIRIGFKDQDGSTEVANYKMTNLKLDSESFSTSIGPNKTVDLNFSLTIGGPNDTTNNVFFSGSHATSVLGTTRTADTSAPVITLNGAASLAIKEDETYVEPGATTDDGSAVTITYFAADGTTSLVPDTAAGVVSTTTALAAASPAGTLTYKVKYNAVDAAGNNATTVERTVTATTDAVDPVITLIGAQSFGLAENETYLEPGATTDDGSAVTISYFAEDGTTSLSPDSSAGVLTTTAAFTAASDPATLVYKVKYEATDQAGRTATPVVRTVTVTAD